MRDFSDVHIEFFVPDGVEWIQGDTMLTTSMEKGEKNEFAATVNIIPEYWHALEDAYQGRFIWVMAKAETPQGKCWRVFSTVMAPSGFVEHSSGGTAGLEVLRARNRIGQPSKEAIEEVRRAVGLPDEPRYSRVASHLWFWELRQLWKRGYDRDESYRIIQDLGRYLARRRRITRSEAIAATVNEGLFALLMARRDRLRAFWSPSRIVAIIATVLLLLLLVILRLTSSRRSVKA
ncbi:MAG: hypothetical protein ACE5JA_10375 [bacterium]